jgi:two-component system sensor histidine kinase BaeS
MGGIRGLISQIGIQLWLRTVVPTTGVFLVTALCVRVLVRQRIAQIDPGGSVSPAEVFDQVFGGGYILGGALVALVLSSILTWLAVKRGVDAYRGATRVTGELTRGNYGMRAPTTGYVTRDYLNLATSINLLAESLERTEQLRRELVSNLAHEIRTPLTNLQGYLEALRDGVIEPTPEALASVHDEVMRLVRLVDALHQLAHADALRQQPKPVATADLDLVVEQLARVIRPTASVRGIQLSLDLNSRHARVPVHADSMAQVVRNLLRNAAQYTDDGGQIRVQTDVADQVYRFTSLNTGPGIPPEDLPFVFNRFYRTERARTGQTAGVGIGLAIAKELVEAHHGRIGAESKAGWTMVWFEIPLDPRERPKTV